MKKRVAIVGKGPGTGLAPFSRGENIWVINNGWVGRSYVSMIVDMHDLDWTVQEIFDHYKVHLSGTVDEKEMWRRAEHSHKNYKMTKDYAVERNVPIMSQKVYKGVPGFEFPREQVCAKYDTDLFTSGVCYAIAYAIYRKFKRIDVFGVNCVKGEEWSNLRECVMMWLGIAKGQGIKVTVTGMEFRPFRAYDKRLYGYNIPQSIRGMPERDTIVNITTEDKQTFVVWRET
jgi:hypothetical protein